MSSAPGAAGEPAGPGVAVVGDVLVDVVEAGDGDHVHPGGAGLNLAMGLRDLAVPVLLAAPMSNDADGHALRAAIEGAGIGLVSLPGHPTTPRAISRRVDGEPQYHFSPELHARHYVFDEAVVDRLRTSTLLVVNSYPLHDPGEVESLRELARRTSTPLVLDPNVRLELVDDAVAMRQGLLALATAAVLVKLSEQDVTGLGSSVSALTRDLFERGVGAVVVTRGSAGAELWTRTGIQLAVPAAGRTDPIVDTMGAGDAVLSQLTHHIHERDISGRGVELDPAAWRCALRDGMESAADLCRRIGGNGLSSTQLSPPRWPEESKSAARTERKPA